MQMNGTGINADTKLYQRLVVTRGTRYARTKDGVRLQPCMTRRSKESVGRRLAVRITQCSEILAGNKKARVRQVYGAGRAVLKPFRHRARMFR